MDESTWSDDGQRCKADQLADRESQVSLQFYLC
jgi:hypothetical protein